MKVIIALMLFSALVVGSLSVPVSNQITDKDASNTIVKSSARQAPNAPAVPVSSSDDDDDDDDDDLDIDIAGDEDEDDDEEEDDDEDDYFERFIEDILGGEEDDDDDDDTVNAVVEPVAPAAPASPSSPSNAQSIIASPPIPAAVQSDLNQFNNEELVTDGSSVNEQTATDTDGYEDEEEAVDTIPEGQAASNIQETHVDGGESLANPVLQAVNTQQVSAAQTPLQSSQASDDDDDDEDDDDEEDDVDLDITEDDDDDEEEDDDEDEDDDDDDAEDAIEDIAGARHAREFKGKSKKHIKGRHLARKSRSKSVSLHRKKSIKS
ncbi:nucleolin-like [Prorops nasuta]|uniref:nucleolin-like n=1 Tax=Prorops nasuta TaxID=863751 RepID=UPI0034CE2CA2